jgi:hypothetical protein
MVATAEERTTMRSTPDPSPLTVQQIVDVKSDLRDYVDVAVTALRGVITARMDAKDEADRVLAENVNRVPTLLDREMDRITKLFDAKHDGLAGKMEEKFEGVQATIDEIKDRSKADGESAKLAIKDALQAQKESAAAIQLSNTDAIGKSETGVKESLNSLDRRISDFKQASDMGLSDLKNKVVVLETSAITRRESREDTHSNVGVIGVVAGGLIGAAGLLIAFLSMHGTVQPPASITYTTPAPTATIHTP